MYRDNARPEPVVFTFARPRFIFISIGLIAVGLFLIALTWHGSSYDRHDRGTLYFFGIPATVLGVLFTAVFALLKPANIILDGDFIVFRKKRFPLAEVVITEPEYRRRGNVTVRAFDLVAADENGKQESLEVNALGWPNFDHMYQTIRHAIAERQAT